MNPAPGPRRGAIAEFAKFLELQNLGLNLPFALAFLVVASNGLPSARLTVLVVVAFVAARNAGHAFNRWADRRFDAANPRTQDRALVTGRYSARTALAIAAFHSAVLLVAAALLNELALLLAPVALLLLFAYSYSKRYSAATTVYLGVVEAATPAAVYIAVDSTVPWPVWFAVGGMLLLGTAFETIHSLGDIDSDRELGLRSIPASLGRPASTVLAIRLHGAALFLLALYGLFSNLTVGVLVVVGAMSIVVAAIDLLVARGGRDVRRPFQLHFLVGTIFLIGVLALEFLR